MRRQVDVELVEAEESVEPVEVRMFDGAEAVHWFEGALPELKS